MSVTINLTSQQFQSLVRNHPSALVDLGLLSAPVAAPVAPPVPVLTPVNQGYTEFVNRAVRLFDASPEILNEFRRDLTSILNGKKVEKWTLTHDNEILGGSSEAPVIEAESNPPPAMVGGGSNCDSDMAMAGKPLTPEHLTAPTTTPVAGFPDSPNVKPRSTALSLFRPRNQCHEGCGGDCLL